MAPFKFTVLIIGFGVLAFLKIDSAQGVYWVKEKMVLDDYNSVLYSMSIEESLVHLFLDCSFE